MSRTPVRLSKEVDLEVNAEKALTCSCLVKGMQGKFITKTANKSFEKVILFHSARNVSSYCLSKNVKIKVYKL
jgi:hypothetical protein